jgi:cell division protein FtsB
VSGPVRAPRAVTAPPIPHRLPQAPPVVERIARRGIAAARTLRDSNMVDRLVRGRSWIGLLGVLLIGLVALNVSLLKLNAAAGRNAEWAKKLRVENADLRARVSRLGSGEQIQASARALGLVMPTAGNVHYLKAGRGDARRAARHASFIPMSSTTDIVSATPPPDPVVVAAPATFAPAAAAPAGATGATGTTGSPAAPAPTSTTATTPTTATAPVTPATGTTGATTP